MLSRGFTCSQFAKSSGAVYVETGFLLTISFFTLFGFSTVFQSYFYENADATALAMAGGTAGVETGRTHMTSAGTASAGAGGGAGHATGFGVSGGLVE